MSRKFASPFTTHRIRFDHPGPQPGSLNLFALYSCVSLAMRRTWAGSDHSGSDQRLGGCPISLGAQVHGHWVRSNTSGHCSRAFRLAAQPRLTLPSGPVVIDLFEVRYCGARVAGAFIIVLATNLFVLTAVAYSFRSPTAPPSLRSRSAWSTGTR